MNLKRIIPLMLAALFLWSATASAAEIFRVAVGDPEDSEQGYAAKAFKKYMEEQSKGQVEVQLFFGGSLGDESEVFRNVQKGSQPFAYLLGPSAKGSSPLRKRSTASPTLMPSTF